MEFNVINNTLVVNIANMELESIRIRKDYVDLVRANKAKTNIPIGKFVESAIESILGKPPKKKPKK